MNTRDHYFTLWRAVHDLCQEVAAYDAMLDDYDGDGSKARPPNGDDYNELLRIVQYHMSIFPYVRCPKRIVKPTLWDRVRDFFVWNLGWNL